MLQRFLTIVQDNHPLYVHAVIPPDRQATPHRIDLRRQRPVHLPLALARVHQSLEPGTGVTLLLSSSRSLDRIGVTAVVDGAGFDPATEHAEGAVRVVAASRARSLPDIVGPGMKILVCGLNPSIYAADRGVGYARPGNRFWPAALAAGLVRRDRDPFDALATGRIGMTDLVKRATTGARDLRAAEYRSGAARVERLVRWLCPGAVCFVGLAGWRAAVDPGAVAGPQPASFGGRPAYVMPSTSGLNAHSSLDDLVGHLHAVADLADIRP